MSVRVRCNQCQELYAVPDDWAGKPAMCEKCGHRLVIPVPAPPPLTDPFTDLLEAALGEDMADDNAMGSPFTGTPSPHGATQGTLKPLPSKRRRASAAGAIGRSRKSGGADVILIGAVILGMSFTFIFLLSVLVTSGLGPLHACGGVILAAGGGILLNGPRKKAPRRDRSTDKARAGTAAAGIGVGIAGVMATCAVAVTMAKAQNELDLARATQMAIPFTNVFVLLTLVSAVALGYYLVALVFPKANILRIAGWGYVAFTVVLPLVLFVLAFMQGMTNATHNRPSSVSAPPEKSDSAKPSGPSFQPAKSLPPTRQPAWPGADDPALKQIVNRFGAERVVVVSISNLPRSAHEPMEIGAQTGPGSACNWDPPGLWGLAARETLTRSRADAEA